MMEPAIGDYAALAAAWMRSALELWIETAWEDTAPDVGEYDFERITNLMMAMIPATPDRDKVEAAYQRFTDRAERAEL